MEDSLALLIGTVVASQAVHSHRRHLLMRLDQQHHRRANSGQSRNEGEEVSCINELDGCHGEWKSNGLANCPIYNAVNEV